ncbi:helix-turn-helix domain-containing protein [Enterococcus sp. CSURQ0835]|uniref:helix-turn-helix domain-containing protein n=1 Tax=Enterococcus sp. CSURQ0835 TaxID=2681394 RepID=UPI0013569D0B|nr:helix-turn-helix domain-containing protein [Enterococcus sp. CSURQ0835]
MKELLKTSVQRRLAIVGKLRDTFDWQPLQKIADELDCTPKTVLSDIDTINHEWAGKVGVEYSKTKGLRLDDSQHNKWQLLFSSIMEQSEAFDFLEKVFFDPNKDAEYWINCLFVSEATFYRMIRQLEHSLKRHGLQIERKPFRVTAPDERWVRIFYQNFFIEKYGLARWPFFLAKQELLCFVNGSSQTFDLLLTDREKMRYTYFLVVLLFRNSQGFLLAPDLLQQKQPPLTTTRAALLAELEKSILRTQLSVSQNWQTEVALSLYYDHVLLKQHEALDVLAELRKFFTELETTFMIELAAIDQKRLFQACLQLYHGYRIYPYRRTLLFNEAELFSRFVKRDYPHFTKLVQQLLIRLEKATDFPWFTQFQAEVLQLLFKNWGQLGYYLDVHSPKVNVLVVSDSGKRHGELLAEWLKSRFYYRVEPTVYGESIFALTDYEKLATYDLVLSNYPLANYPYPNLQLIDDFLDDLDFLLVSQQVKQKR